MQCVHLFMFLWYQIYCITISSPNTQRFSSDNKSMESILSLNSTICDSPGSFIHQICRSVFSSTQCILVDLIYKESKHFVGILTFVFAKSFGDLICCTHMSTKPKQEYNKKNEYSYRFPLQPLGQILKALNLTVVIRPLHTTELQY